MYQIMNIMDLQIIMLSSASDYNLFKNFTFKEGTEGMMQMAMIAFNLICWCAVAFFAFKTLQGLYQYFSNHNNPQLRAQYKSDATEPVRGLIMLLLGTTLFNIIVFLIFGNTLGITF